MELAMLDASKHTESGKFIRFNEYVFPGRSDVRKRFVWHYIRNPALGTKEKPYILLYYNEGKEIVGQSLLNAVRWHLNGKGREGCFGADFYVLDKYRGAVGAAMIMKTIKDAKGYFVIGISDISKKLVERLGIRTIGKLKIFIWLNPLAPIALIKEFMRKPMNSKSRREYFPREIKANGTEFKLINKIEDWKEYHWSKTVEFSRSREFLNWRFFDSPRKYYFYISNDPGKPVYFVVRKCRIKGMNILVLVDYRIPYMDADALNSILKASKSLVMKNNCIGILVGSSHRFFDKELKKSFFFYTRKGSRIMTGIKDVFDGVSEKRNLIYVTLADSDVDLNLDNILR